MTEGARDRAWVLHPFLLVGYVVIGLLAENVGEAQPLDAARALWVLLALTGLGFLALRRLCGDTEAGLLCTAALFVLFWHATLFGAEPGEGSAVGTILILVAELAALIGLGAGLAHFRPGHANAYRKLSRGLDVVVGALCVLALAEVLVYQGGEDDAASRREATRVVAPVALPAGAAAGPRPDIYYIVLDAYTRSDTLQAYYNGDDRRLLGFLRQHGFRVLERSRTNYLSTKLVLPTVFGLDYLDGLADRVGRDSMDVRPLRAVTERNRVVETLRGLGYRIVHINSGPDYVTIADPDEALELAPGPFGMSAFEGVLFEMTPLPALLDATAPGGGSASARQHRRRVEYAIDALAGQGRAPGPKLVIAHVFAPHDPIVFGRHGEQRSVSIRLFHDYTKPQLQYLMSAYRDEVHYLDGLVVAALERVLDESETSPIIVLQGDHGLRLFLERRAEDSCLRESFAILNAVRLPGVDTDALPATLSPVNTFRLIFDAYFGAELGLLEDRAYFSHRFGLYDFVDVTAEAETCSTVQDMPPPL